MSVTEPDQDPLPLDTSVAHPARIYDYWLGGKDNFAADRWRPGPDEPETDNDWPVRCGVARKP